MIDKAILLMIVLFLLSLFVFYGWDYYMKITGKPVLKNKCIRYCIIHYGRYSENEIAKNNSSLQLPSDENLYTVSKIVFGLEIGNLFYAIAVFVLCGLSITQKNTDLVISAWALIAVYLVGIMISVIICAVKTKKAERLEWEKKYQVLIQSGYRNMMTLYEAETSIFEGKRVCFNLYGLDFLLDIYPRDVEKIELCDLTHQRILTVDKDLSAIANTISVNNQSLNSLWAYLDISIEDPTIKERQ